MIGSQHPFFSWKGIRVYPPNFLKTERIHYTYNARGAIHQVCNQIKDDRRMVLVPDFHCPTVVDPVLAAGCTPLYYRVGSNLKIDLNDLKGKLRPSTLAVIVIHYFGFEYHVDELRSLAQSEQFYLIEDWAHSFLKIKKEGGIGLSGQDGGINIYSFKKLVPMGTGGGYVTTLPYRDDPIQCGIKKSIKVYKDIIDYAVLQNKGGVNKAYSLLIKVIKKFINPPFAVETQHKTEHNPYPFDGALSKLCPPYLSKKILFHDNLIQNAVLRRHHFKVYLSHLKENRQVTFLKHELPDDTVPWAFPILIKERGEHDYKLRALGVPLFTFGEFLHPHLTETDKGGGMDVHELSNTLTLLPIHKNMRSKKIVLICDIINQYFIRANAS